MWTVVLANQKGGAGKTSLAASLAVAAAEAGHKVIALDLDPQGSLFAWGTAREGAGILLPQLDVETVDANQLARLPAILQALAGKGYTLAVLDTAGVENTSTHLAMQAADLVLIPARPTRIDIAATRPTFRAAARLGREVAFVLNQCPVQSRSSRSTEAASGLSMLGALAQPMIAARTDHQDAIASGQGVTEYDSAGKAAQEINALWQWVSAKLKGVHHGNAQAAAISA